MLAGTMLAGHALARRKNNLATRLSKSLRCAIHEVSISNANVDLTAPHPSEYLRLRRAQHLTRHIGLGMSRHRYTLQPFLRHAA